MAAILILFGLLTAPLSGCISSSCGAGEDCEPDDMMMGGDEPADVWIGTTFPDFDLMDSDGNNWTNQDMAGEVWIAYFSAVWCIHCETTFNAYDYAIPEGKFLALNKEARAGYSNMSEWRNTTSERLDREITRPFIHAPILAEELEVYGIPHAFFVDGEGVIVDYTYGVQNSSAALEVRYQENGGVLS